MTEKEKTKKRRKRYERAFRPMSGSQTGTIFINDIPEPLYRRFRNRLSREDRSIRGVVLSLIQEWLRHERAGEVADSERSGGVYGDWPSDDLHAGEGQEAPGVTDHGQPGSPLPQGVVRRVDDPEHHHPDGGEPAVDRLNQMQVAIDELRVVVSELIKQQIAGER